MRILKFILLIFLITSCINREETNIKDSFILINKQLDLNLSIVNSRCDTLLKKCDRNEIVVKIDSAYTYIDDLISRLLKLDCTDISNLKNPMDWKKSTNLLFNNAIYTDTPVFKLKAIITELSTIILNNTSNAQLISETEKLLDTNDVYEPETRLTWESNMLERIPIIGCITNLKQLQYNLRFIETGVLKEMIKKNAN